MPTFKPKKQFLISGTNLNFVDRVFFGTEQVSNLAQIDATGLSGTIPSAAFTAPVTIEANSQNIIFDQVQVVLDSASQIVVSGIDSESVSGKAGEVVTISGENFYQITDVKFGDVSSNFSVISDGEIQASVPENADYSGIRVLSTVRTGLNGSTSQASGISDNAFVPVPEISMLNTGQLASGETLIISGSSFAAVTGVTINDIEMESVTVVSSSGIQMTVPSGNVKGVPTLLAQSGVKQVAPSTVSFSPLAKATGVQTGVELGSVMAISGENLTSDLLYSGIEHGEYLVSIGDQTGNFKIVSDGKMTGVAPTGLNISVSGNLAAGQAQVSSHSVFLYSNEYPQEYPANISFTPLIGSAVVNSVTPSSGVAGDLITLEGTNLFAVTGINLGNVGFGTATPFVNVIEEGKKLSFEIPSASYNATGADLDINISGYFSSATVTGGASILGNPTITSIFPSTNVAPSSTGTIYGTNLYSGTTAFLQNQSINPQFFQGYLDISGYLNNDKEIVFYYPNSFETGIDYRVRVRNRRSASTLQAVDTLKSPTISGYSPLSGEYGDQITISGYFEPITTSGLSLGNAVVNDFTQTSTTGINFTIPNDSLSDIINISTSGGFISTSGIVGVSPSKPFISGYFPGDGEAPSGGTAFSTSQVFGEGNLITITGERANLVTGVIFSGATGEISVGTFKRKGPQSLVVNIPDGINSGSGQFLIRDFRRRETTSPFDINITKISGFDNYLKVGENFTLSGENISGLSVGFLNPTGGQIFTEAIAGSNTVLSNVESATFQVPTGIGVGEILLTGRDNTLVSRSSYDFNPLALITGTSGTNSITTGNKFIVTGINSYNGNTQRMPTLIGISGTGNEAGIAETQFLSISGTSSGIGIGSNSALYYETYTGSFPNSFIGTGQLFLTNTWDFGGNYASRTDPVLGPESATNLVNQISYFPQEFAIAGTRVNATGYAPIRGVTGSNVEISGQGFSAITGVYFAVPSGEFLQANFTTNSDNKITATVPSEGIESRGNTSLLLSGGTNFEVGNFEVILDASVVEFNIVEQNDTPTSSTRVGNFTQKETINGDVFLVTRTRFPDGTTAVISSTPEA
jgi:hypothetical protein